MPKPSSLDNNFELPITYKGIDYLLPTTLVTYGYSYKIAVTVFDTIINFEPDEERNFRAVVNAEEINHSKKLDTVVLQQMATTLEELLK